MTAEHDDDAHDDLRKQVAALEGERQESRDHRTPLVPPLRFVRVEGPRLARGLW